MIGGMKCVEKRKKIESWKKSLARDYKLNKFKYLIILPVIIYLFVFSYKPMYGLIIAFKEFRVRLGIMGSPWVGLQQFESFFNDIYFWRIIGNTFSISGLSIIFGFPMPILLALLLNEIRNNKFKRTVQTISYMPYFISIVIMCGLIKAFSQSNGVLNDIIVFLGGSRTNLLSDKKLFYPIYIIANIWRTIGWDSIIYLAAIAGIDQDQYEAARVDGAGRIRQIFSITIPALMPTIIILFILRMGGILNVGYEMILLLYQPLTYEVADVISTYVYRRGILEADYSYSTAVGLFNSVVNIGFLMLTNKIGKKVSDISLY